MSHSEKYTLWLSMTLFHEYYGEGACPITMTPSRETQYFLKRFNILFLKQSTNSWILLKDERLDISDLLDDEVVFSFELYPQSENYYYVSLKNDLENVLFFTEKSNIPNIWKKIQLNLKQIIDTSQEKIEIKIDTLHKHYEYICIPKYSNTDIQIKLKEERNRATLSDAEQIKLQDIPVAFKFITQEMIKLTKQNSFKMQLWEMRENGEVLISSVIPNPQPNQYSIFDSKNSIVSYFYY